MLTVRITAMDLSPEEIAWMRAHPVVRVGFSPSFPPYSFPAAQGRMQGIDLDYLHLIGERTGLRFEPVVEADWPSVEAAFNEGRVDLLTLLVGSPDQRNTKLLSRPYLFVPRIIVSRTDAPYLLRTEDLRGLSVGVLRGFVSREGAMHDILKESRRIEYVTGDEMLAAVARGEVDATVCSSIYAAYVIRAQHLTNLRLGSVIDAPLESHFGAARANAPLISIIDKALSDLTTAERREIDERWVAIDVRPSPWLLILKIAVGVLAVALLAFAVLYAHQRRLTRELAERRRIQNQLEEAHSRVARISEEKTALLRMVVHDIRGPLAGMLLASDFAEMQGQGEEATLRTLLHRFRDSTKRLLTLVNTLLDAQATEDGVRRYASDPTDVVWLLRQVAGDLNESARHKRIELKLETAESHMQVTTDAGALRQVLENLLSNALKYAPSGSVVTAGAHWTETQLRITVADQGPGISEEVQARLFTRYGKGVAHPTGGEKSIGLGLWIVRQIVAGLGGIVRYDGNSSGGARFIVELPRGDR